MTTRVTKATLMMHNEELARQNREFRKELDARGKVRPMTDFDRVEYDVMREMARALRSISYSAMQLGLARRRPR